MLGVGETPIPSLCNISVSFKIYDYLPISPIGRSGGHCQLPSLGQWNVKKFFIWQIKNLMMEIENQEKIFSFEK